VQCNGENSTPVQVIVRATCMPRKVCRTYSCTKEKRRGGLCRSCLDKAGLPAALPPKVTLTPVLRLRFPCASADGLSQKFVVEAAVLEGLKEKASLLPMGSGWSRDIIEFDEGDEATVSAWCGAITASLAHLDLKIVGQCSARMILAPPWSQQNPQSQGMTAKLHRDVDTVEAGYYSVLVCLTEVTETNGSVYLWPGTQRAPLDDHHRGRAVSGLGSVELTGAAGTAWVFDSRLLHQSQPNTTETARMTFQFMCYTAAVSPPVVHT
jgi:hypothetical protein